MVEYLVEIRSRTVIDKLFGEAGGLDSSFIMKDESGLPSVGHKLQFETSGNFQDTLLITYRVFDVVRALQSRKIGPYFDDSDKVSRVPHSLDTVRVEIYGKPIKR